MANEWILIINLIVCYGLVLFWFTCFGKEGLMAFTAVTMILANIEVNVLIVAFGLEQTLGNVMFACSFLMTDIISEIYGKKAANKTVNIGILSAITMVLISQLWLTYTPSVNDGIFEHVQALFGAVPRIIFASLIVNIITQKIDVLLYHGIWKTTTKLTGNSHRLLWVRNNASTLTSQLFNAVLFNFAAFYGTMPIGVIGQLIASSYVIFVITSLLDTPIIYLVRLIHEKRTKTIVGIGAVDKAAIEPPAYTEIAKLQNTIDNNSYTQIDTVNEDSNLEDNQ